MTPHFVLYLFVCLFPCLPASPHQPYISLTLFAKGWVKGRGAFSWLGASALIAVDERTDVEVGALLKESVPQKWRYLLDKVNLSDHKEMMEILTNKFGRARIIVDECTAEIRRMKVITTDREFINFVDNVDKLKRDLDQLGLLSDIAISQHHSTYNPIQSVFIIPYNLY